MRLELVFLELGLDWSLLFRSLLSWRLIFGSWVLNLELDCPQFGRINNFVEAHLHHLIPFNSLHDNITDTDNDSDVVADVDPDILIPIVRTELKMVKALGIDMSTTSISRRQKRSNRYRILKSLA